jgi:multisubunit Na+/H+ antiporter MnhF subunit
MAALDASAATGTGAAANPLAPHHLPFFITAPGATDILLIAVAIFLFVTVLFVGNLFLKLHTLPERLAHKSQKLQFEVVAVLGLLALFTHQHIFWVIGLLLALIEVPDFSTPLRRMAGSLEKMARIRGPEPTPETEPEVLLAETRPPPPTLVHGKH